MTTLHVRFRDWWCKRFHQNAPYWWGEEVDGGHFYCCFCNRELFTESVNRHTPLSNEREIT